MSFSSSMWAGIVWRNRVAQSGQRSCRSRVVHSWELRNLSKAVAQAELRYPTKSGEVVESDFIRIGQICTYIILYMDIML